MSNPRPLPAMLAAVAAATLTATTAPVLADTITYQEANSPTTTYTEQETTVRTDKDTNPQNGGVEVPGSLASGAYLRAIMSLPLTGLTAGDTVTGVSFTVYQQADTSGSADADYTASLVGLSRSFDEATATWGNTFGDGSMTLGSVLSTVTINPTDNGVTVIFASTPALVSYVQAAVDNGTPLNMAVVLPDAEHTTTRAIFRFTSDEPGNNAGFAPKLKVDYTPVPEPASLSLLAAGGLLVLGRRQHA